MATVTEKTRELKNMKYQPIAIDMGKEKSPIHLAARSKIQMSPAIEAALKDKNSQLFSLVERDTVKVIENTRIKNDIAQPVMLDTTAAAKKPSKEKPSGE